MKRCKERSLDSQKQKFMEKLDREKTERPGMNPPVFARFSHRAISKSKTLRRPATLADILS